MSAYELRVSGRAAHAGLEPERGINATVELAHQIGALVRLADPVLGTTVTPTTATSGSTRNTVPATASVRVDVRARTLAEQQRVDTALRAFVPLLPGAVLEIDGGLDRPPLEEHSSAALFARARRLYAELGLDDGELRGVAVGGGSDGNITAGVGTPTLDGLGAVGGGAHADHEHVSVEEIPARTALLAALVAELRAEPSAATGAAAAGSTESALVP